MNNRLMSIFAVLSIAVFLLVAIITHENTSEQKAPVITQTKKKKKIDGVKIKKKDRKTASKVDIFAMRRDEIIWELMDINQELDEISMRCEDELDELLDFQNVVGFSYSEDKFYKNFDKVHQTNRKLIGLLDNYLAKISNKKNNQLDLLVKHSSYLFPKREDRELERIVDHEMYTCSSMNLDTFIDDTMRSISNFKRTEHEFKILQEDILKLLAIYFKDIKDYENLRNGMALLIQATQMQIIEPTYLGNLKILQENLVERKSEFLNGMQAVDKPAEFAIFLQNEFLWRQEFIEEVLDYVSQSTINPYSSSI